MECLACHSQQPDLEGARFCAICGTLLPRYNEDDPLVGRTVGGRFRIKNLIAIGGMGRVYGAEQQMGATLRRIAVKVLLSDYTVNQDVVSRFMRECSTVSELEHPNTIKFYDYGQTDDGHLYIAMEYVPGPSLATVMKNEGALPAERIDRITAQICGSLQEAHDKGFIHRDLKPENILLSTHAGEEDFVKVLDFGIAKRVGANVPKITQEGMVLGSPPYMSPEQFTRAELDCRSDIYSLAVVLYKALTGKKPFRAETAVEWATEHMTAQPLPFEATPVGAAVPPSMKRAILHALMKRPIERPQTMRDFYGEFTIGATRSSLLGRSGPPPAWTGSNPPIAGWSGSAPPPPPVLDASAGIAHPSAEHSTLAGVGSPEALPPAGGRSLAAGGTIVMDGGSGASVGDSGRPPPVGLAPSGGSGPPPRLEPVPPTMREPVPPTVRIQQGRGKMIASSIAGVLVLVGGVLLVMRLLEAPSSGKTVPGSGTAATTATGTSRTNPSGAPSAVPTAPTAPTQTTTTTATAAGAVPSAVPSAVPTTKPGDPCREAINAALQNNCPVAQHYRKLCPENHPNHRDAHVTIELHCPNP